MPKIIFWGESVFTFLGLKSILSDFYPIFDVVYVPLSNKGFIYSFMEVRNYDFVIASPDENSLLHYVKVMREMPVNKNNVMIFAEEKIHKLFEIMCGRRFYFVNSDSALSVIFESISSFLNGHSVITNNHRNKLSETEFQIVLLMAKGWSLTKIASFTNRSVKTVSAHKINITKKMKLTDRQFKLLVSKGEF